MCKDGGYRQEDLFRQSFLTQCKSMDELCEENVMFPTGFVPSRLVWASVANVLWRDSGEFGHLLGFI